MNASELRELIKQELPQLVRDDPEIQDLILRLSRQEFAPKQQTEDRFDRLFAKLERDTEIGNRRWEEHNRRWEENQAELRRMREESERQWNERREESERKWKEHLEESERERKEQREESERERKEQREESEGKWKEHLEESERERKEQREESERKWKEHLEESERERKEQREESEGKWKKHLEESARERKEQREESERKWKEHREEFDRVHEEIMAMTRKYDRTVGALGSRWGLCSEKAFRDALASVLEKSFDVQVLNVTEYDDLGTVFGRPDQIELDVIIVNGTLILMELKSSVGKADMYIFERKARFYEKLHERKANRLIVISPMIDAKARLVGERLGIEMFGDSVLVESL